MAHFEGRGFKIHYVEQGHGPAVVFAHGLIMDHTMFAPQFEELPDRYRCIAWDMRGHGRSECPPGPWTLQDIAVDLIRFIEDADAAPCHLVGMSIGGMAALRVAIQREDLLRSLVCIDTSADAESPEFVAMHSGFAETITRTGVTPELAEATLPLFFAERYREDTEAMRFHIDRAIYMERDAVLRGIEALDARVSVLDRLGEIRVPALVIHGEQDAAIPVEQGEKLASGIPGARLLRVPGAGHTTPLEAPDAVNEALAEFLDSVRT